MKSYKKFVVRIPDTEQDKPIKIGRHDNNFDFLADCVSNQRIRLGSRNPNSLNWIEYNIFSTDGCKVLFDSFEYSILEFFQFVTSNKITNLLVLTRVEKNLILPDAVSFDCEVGVFEDLFPIFPHIRYTSNLKANISESKKLLNNCKNMQLFGGSASKYLSTFFRFKQERALRFKSSLDNTLYFASLPPYQEVFKAKETRPDRLIIALDFNAMFSECMLGDFPSPKHLKYENFLGIDFKKSELKDGFYRAKLIKAKDTLFLVHHPFRYCRSNKSFNFNLKIGDSVEVFLPRDEIDYYSKYFLRTEIIEGVYSTKKIKHPLSYRTQASYSVRKAPKSSQARSCLAKLEANIIASSGNPKRYRSFYCNDKNTIVKHIEKAFSIKFDGSLSEDQKIELGMAGNRVIVSEIAENEFHVKIFCNKSNDSIYALHSKILSNSRIKMLKLIEKLSIIDSLELCYANVDSLHVSIELNDKAEFDELISSSISSDMGDLKIEATATSGYWFDLGRYWLRQGNNTTKFSNYLFNEPHSFHIFKTNRKINKVVSLFGFKYVKSTYINLINTFGYKKRIEHPISVDHITYRRYDLDDVVDASVASKSEQIERIQSLSLKSSLFSELVTGKCSSNTTHKL